jgi:hypothetical protein
MDEERPEAAVSLEAVLQGWSAELSEAERQAAALLRSVRRLRHAAEEGAVAALPTAAAAARAEAERAAAATARAAAVPAYDLATAFASGAYLEELAEAARAAGVTLVRRDGRITAFPIALRLEARAQGVRIGRRLEKRIRPRVLAEQLRRLQQRPDRFNARAFLDRLLKPYAWFARDEQWRASVPGRGPLVALADLHEALTLWPAAAADYPAEEFAADLLRLDRQPDARSGQGHRFELAGSTGMKGAKRLTVFDEAGAQHDYFAIRFLLDP